MGLIKAAIGATGGVLADSWREFFYCDADVLNNNTLVAKGQVRTSKKRSSNTSGEENIISNGSLIAVNDGQCMIIVESGEIVEICADAGEFEYDSSTEPSLFYGSLGEGITASIKRIGERFRFGGDTGKDQRVYYINTKEIFGNKYGTQTPIPFRIIDTNLGLDMDTSIRMNGEYSYRIIDPIVFYKNVCGNIESNFSRDRIDSQMKSELLTALQPALARISEEGVRYSALPGHTKELASLLNEELSDQWIAQRGICIETVGINSITLPEEIEKQISNRQMAQTLSNPSAAAATIASATADSMRAAAANENGAMNAFMGLGMASNFGGNTASQLFEQGAQQATATDAASQAGQVAPANATASATNAANARLTHNWTCTNCGAANSGKFCSECGTPKPAEEGRWFCPECGTPNTGKFCPNDGTPRP